MLHVSLRVGQARCGLRLWLAVLGLMLASVAHAQSALPSDSQADALAAAGRPLEAAARYEQLAKRGLFTWDAGYALRAAGAYLDAGEPDEADRMLDKARSRARTIEERTWLGALDARLALDRGDAARALGALDTVPRPVPRYLAPRLLELRLRAQAAAGLQLAAVRTWVERAALLATPPERAANDRLLLDQLLLNPPSPAAAAAGTNAVERGWLELPALLALAGRDKGGLSADAIQRLQQWQAQYPDHPGAAFLPSASASTAAAPAQPPTLAAGASARIALLLPLSGKQAAAGQAVRDGFAAAWFATGSVENRPRLDVYDTANGAAAAYQQAIANGAQAVVGPLLKEDVAALVAALPAGLPVATLALNSYPVATGAPPAFLYQFALDPEQEARAVAQRIAADGRVRGIALFPDSAWGQRVRDAFVAELQATGVVLTASQFYAPGASDFAGPLRAALGRYGGAGDRPADRSQPAPSRNAAAEQAEGPQFAFIAATPQAARAIRPQLRFQMTYDLPLYTTSDAWDASVRSAADMDGMVFPEMPWLLYGGQGAPELWEALQSGEWAGRGRGRLRLFAFGYDAYRLVQQIGASGGAAGLDGLTGLLELDRGSGRVQRRLQFARIEGGRPQPAATGAPVPMPAEPATNSGGQPRAP